MTTPLQRTLLRAKGPVGPQDASLRAKNAPETDSTSSGNWAIDVDGVADAFPRVVQSLMSALMAAGHHVFVITGVDGDTVTDEDRSAKVEYLLNLGIGPECYTEVVVCPDPHPENKAKAIQDNNIGVLLDNNKANVKAAARFCVALLLWNSKE